ncbi:Arm DNA-binding domain-containing protein [Allopusillimonas ginsengisoli]|uniref:Arm DNA-binding domain-containing protein n=1 Tax=Allopusillimonas ginsengisoli TaxID=453575 RepID=UPI0031456511
MARVIPPLTDLRCRQARYSPTGRKKLFDGGGLYLELTTAGSKIWRMKYRQLTAKKMRAKFRIRKVGLTFTPVVR